MKNSWTFFFFKKDFYPAVRRPVAVWASFVCFVTLLFGHPLDALLAENVATASQLLGDLLEAGSKPCMVCHRLGSFVSLAPNVGSVRIGPQLFA